MFIENSSMKKYPEWYRIERETEKTINRLTRIEELKFYLKSPDAYFRRLAILRGNALKLKDSIGFLEEILDDPSESQINKDLAAWSIKSICLKWNIELFVSNRLIHKFTGNEKYHDIYKINIKDSFSLSQVDLSASPATSKLELDNNYNYQQNRDVNFETYFSFQDWIQVVVCELMTTGKQRLMGLPLKIFNALKSLTIKNFTSCVASLINIKKLPSKLHELLLTTLNNHRNIGRNPRKYPTTKNYGKGKMAQLITLIGNVCDQILYLLCYPIRLILRNKTFMVAALIALYYLLTFTDAGISFTKERFGVSLIEIQNSFLGTNLMETRNEISTAVKKVLFIAWVQIKDIADWMYIKWIEEIRGK